MYKTQRINDKDIYIVEDHHLVIEPWAIYRISSESSPILITLDHLTDCLPAFNRFCNANDFCRNRYSSKINYNKIQTVREAINKLKHDEHINAAINANIIDKAFVINYDASFNKPSSFREAERIKKFVHLRAEWRCYKKQSSY